MELIGLIKLQIYISFKCCQKPFSDQAAAASGYDDSCPEGIPAEFALLSILGAFGVAFGILYRALTLTTSMRRKRRNVKDKTSIFFFGDIIRDLTWAGGSLLS